MEDAVGVEGILRRRNPFEISLLVVLTVAVFVVDFVASWGWAVERLGYQSCNKPSHASPWEMEADEIACSPSKLLRHDMTSQVIAAPRVRSFADMPIGTGFVETQCAGNGAPDYFASHKLARSPGPWSPNP